MNEQTVSYSIPEAPSSSFADWRRAILTHRIFSCVRSAKEIRPSFLSERKKTLTQTPETNRGYLSLAKYLKKLYYIIYLAGYHYSSSKDSLTFRGWT